MAFQRSTLFRIVFSSALLVTWAGCTKDNFTTSPQLKFIKAENYTVPQGGLIKFYLQVTDQEGDLTDSLFIQGISKNCRASNFLVGFNLPKFPTQVNTKVDLEVTFINGVFGEPYPPLTPQCGRPDTTTFRFWIRDKANNVSDTVQTDKPIIILK